LEKHSNIWENSSFGEQFQFWRKITIFEKNLGKILILRKIPIFGKIFFLENYNCGETFKFLGKISIFEKNYN